MEVTKFVSYGTKYDYYKGSKDWCELTPKEQNEAIKSSLLANKNELMATELLKSQADGLDSLFVAIALQLEKNGVIKDITWNNNLALKISEFLSRTIIGKRVDQALSDITQDVILIKGEDLEEIDDELYEEIALATSAKEAKEIIFNVFGWEDYEGEKDWSEIGIEEQNKIIKSAASDDDVICGYVMESKLLKIQAEGLNYLFNKIFLNYWLSQYRAGNIEIRNNSNDSAIKDFLQDTVIGTRFIQAVNSQHENVIFVDGKCFELIAEEEFEEDDNPLEVKNYIKSVFGKDYENMKIDYDNMSHDQFCYLFTHKKADLLMNMNIISLNWDNFRIKSPPVLMAIFSFYLSFAGTFVLWIFCNWYTALIGVVLIIYTYNYTKDLMAREIGARAIESENFFIFCTSNKIIRVSEWKQL